MAGLRETIDGLQILVVDDEPEVARGLERNLTKAGARVTVARSLSEALQHLERNTVWDIVLIDQMLPDGDGLDVLDGVDRLQTKPAIIAISANLQCSKRSLRLQACGAVLLPKPFDLEDLRMALSAALASRDRSVQAKHASQAAQSSTKTQAVNPKHLLYKSISLNLVTQIASVDGTAIDLQPAQTRILAQLLAHPGQRFGVNELTKSSLRGNHDQAGGNMRFQIHALRRRLGTAGRLIETLDRGYGIGLNAREELAQPRQTRRARGPAGTGRQRAERRTPMATRGPGRSSATRPPAASDVS
jgi:DNA-binding response OmpR family regulator